jgi:hypothetical protein
MVLGGNSESLAKALSKADVLIDDAAMSKRYCTHSPL